LGGWGGESTSLVRDKGLRCSLFWFSTDWDIGSTGPEFSWWDWGKTAASQRVQKGERTFLLPFSSIQETFTPKF